MEGGRSGQGFEVGNVSRKKETRCMERVCVD